MLEKILEYIVVVGVSISSFFFGIFSHALPLSVETIDAQVATSSVSEGKREESSFVTQKIPPNPREVPSLAVQRENYSPPKEDVSPSVLESVVLPQESHSVPGPMYRSDESKILQEGVLSVDEIVHLSNEERKRFGLSVLQKNLKLTAMAVSKTEDMISRQYFAHVSPMGIDIGDLAKTYGYQYLHVGENLALGDFASSSHVVDGWMNSPGHRANILGKDYTEIGVAVMRGAWEGREVWWAVQEFGKPMPNCAPPSGLLEEKISIFEEQLTTLKITLDKAEEGLTSGSHNAEYRKKVDEYNLLVELFNGILAQQKVMISSYNEEVKSYNECISE